MKERPRKWFHETTELALSLTSYIAPDDTDIKDRRVFAGICQPQRFHRGSHAQARRFRLAPQCHVVSIGNMPRPSAGRARKLSVWSRLAPPRACADRVSVGGRAVR